MKKTSNILIYSKNLFTSSKSAYFFTNTFLSALLLICIFDPTDINKLKICFFAAAWISFFIDKFINDRKIYLPKELFLYVITFISIPILSVIFYKISNGAEPYQGFNMLKGYFFITLAPLLVLTDINLLPRLSIMLTILSLLSIITFIIIQVNPNLYTIVKDFGNYYDIFIIDTRQYGNKLVLLQVYYLTSPMIVISISYYMNKVFYENTNLAKNLTLAFINILGIFVGGTRNNILASLILPLLLIIFNGNKKMLYFSFIKFIIIIIFIYYNNYIDSFFNVSEYSNSIKINYLKDYINIFSNPLNLFFGQGLGSYEYFSSKNNTLFITELTYFEVFRYFGLIGGTVMIYLLIFPIRKLLLNKRSSINKCITIGYIFYLLMCFTNPNFFNSMGVLFISLLFYQIYSNNYFFKKR